MALGSSEIRGSERYAFGNARDTYAKPCQSLRVSIEVSTIQRRRDKENTNNCGRCSWLWRKRFGYQPVTRYCMRGGAATPLRVEILRPGQPTLTMATTSPPLSRTFEIAIDSIPSHFCLPGASSSPISNPASPSGLRNRGAMTSSSSGFVAGGVRDTSECLQIIVLILLHDCRSSPIQRTPRQRCPRSLRTTQSP